MQVLDAEEVGVSTTNVSVSIRAVRNPGAPGPLDCSTKALADVEGTLEGLRRADACFSQLSVARNETDSVGLSRIAGLTLRRGPPAVYDLAFVADDNPSAETRADVQFFSRVATLVPVDESGDAMDAPVATHVGQPLLYSPDSASRVPSVRVAVFDKAGKPVEGAHVTLITWTSPYFWKESGMDTAVPNARRGQQFGLVANAVSLPSGVDGIASWPLDAQPSIAASTSRTLWLGFYAEGTLLSWSNPQDRVALDIPKPPKLLLPTQVVSAVRNVRIETQPSLRVVEGKSFDVQPIVSVHDSQGSPVQGATVLAIVVSEAGFVFPMRNKDALRITHHKELVHARSLKTDANGIAQFESLGFAVQGIAGEFRIAFVCNGIESDWSQPIVVDSIVAAVNIVQIPNPVHMLTGEGGENEAALLGAISVLRVVDENDQGVPGKMSRAFMLDSNGNAVPGTKAEGGSFPVDVTDSMLRVESDNDGFLDTPIGVAWVGDSSLFENGVRFAFCVDDICSLPSATTTISDAGAPSSNHSTVFIQTDSQVPNQAVTLDGQTPLSVWVRAMSAFGVPVPNAEVRLLAVDGGVFSGVAYPYKGPFFDFVDGNDNSDVVSGITDSDGLVELKAVAKRAPPGLSSVYFVAVVVHDDMTLEEDRLLAVNAFSSLTRVTFYNPIADVIVVGGDGDAALYDLGEQDRSATGGVGLNFQVRSADGSGIPGLTGAPVLLETPANLQLSEYANNVPFSFILRIAAIMDPDYDGPVFADGSGSDGEGGASEDNAVVYFFAADRAAVVSALQGEGSSGSLTGFQRVQLALQRAYFGSVQYMSGSDQTGQLFFGARAPTSGIFSFTLDVFGVRSKPLVFSVASLAGKLTIVRQPSAITQIPELVGNFLRVMPEVRVLDPDNRPLAGYRVTANAVNDDGSPAPVLLDLVDDETTNLAGFRSSLPSRLTGIAEFTKMVFVEALSGCFRLRFSYDDGHSPVVYSELSDPVCVVNLDSYAIAQQPSLTTSIGAQFPTPLQVLRRRPYSSDLDGEGFATVLALVDGYKENFRRPPNPEEDDDTLSDVVHATFDQMVEQQVAALTGGDAGAVFPGALLPGDDAVSSLRYSPAIVSTAACVVLGGVAVVGDCRVVPNQGRATGGGNGDSELEVVLEMSGLTWDFAQQGDQMTIRGYSALVLARAADFSLRRAFAPPEGECDGADGGKFAACCDSSDECASGICDVEARTCTVSCETDADCKAYPEPRFGTPRCDPVKKTCAAEQLVSWSFARYCRNCQGGIEVETQDSPVSYSGSVGPAVLPGAVKNAVASLVSLYDEFCLASEDNFAACSSILPAVMQVADRVTEICGTSPAVLALCRGGFSKRAFTIAMLTLTERLFHNSEGSTPTQEMQRVAVEQAVKVLLSTGSQSGRTEASSVLEISALPAQLFVVKQPPAEISIGEVFEVVVELSIGTGAALPAAAVKASIQVVDESGGAIDAEKFIAEAQSSIDVAAAPWEAPLLDPARSTVATDGSGAALFRLRIVSAPPGEYTLQFSADTVSSPQTNKFRVVNSVASVELDGTADISEVASEFPHPFQPFTPVVRVLDGNSKSLSNVSADVRVYALSVRDDIFNETRDLASAWDSLPAVARATTFFKLLVQGSRRLGIGSNPGPPVDISLGPARIADDGSIEFPGLSVVARAPGKFVLVTAVRGIASQVSEEIVVMSEEENAGLQAMADLGLRASTCFACGLILVGNSAWHHKAFIVTSIMLLVAVIAFTPFIIDQQTEGAGSVVTVYVTYVILGMAGLLFVYLGIVEAIKKTHLLFPAQRQRAYLEYATKIWSRPATTVSIKALATEDRVAEKKVNDERLRCATCESRPSELSCITCRDVFCRECSLRVHDGRLGRKHIIVPGRDALRRTELAEAVAARPKPVSPKDAAKITADQLRACWRSYSRSDDSDAFFYPSKMTGAFVISVLAVVTLFVTVVNNLEAAQISIGTADARALRTAFAGIDALEELFFQTFNSDMLQSETDFAYQQAYLLHEEFVILSDSFITSVIIGMTVGTLVFFLAWLVLLLDFRQKIMDARRGKYDFNRELIYLADASNYVGVQISNGLMTFALLVVIIALAAFPLIWHVPRDLVFANWLLIVNLIWPALVNVVIKKVWGYSLATSASPYDHVKRRRCFNAYDLFQSFMQMYTGIVTALVRFILVVVIGLLTLPRLDRSPMPAWVERYLLLDTGSKAYHATILQYATFNNPLGRTFAWIMEDILKKSRAARSGSQAGSSHAAGNGLTAVQRRVSRRWQLAVLLLRNPSLRTHRCRLTRAEVEQREADRATDGSTRAPQELATASSVHENPLAKAQPASRPPQRGPRPSAR